MESRGVSVNPVGTLDSAAAQMLLSATRARHVKFHLFSMLGGIVLKTGSAQIGKHNWEPTSRHVTCAQRICGTARHDADWGASTDYHG